VFKLDVTREQRRVKWAVVMTILSMPLLIALYFGRHHRILLVFALGFMLGYIVERLRLSRKLISLSRHTES
jgi:hypothetical protein